MHTDYSTNLGAPARGGEDFLDDSRVLKQTAAGSVRKLLSPNLLGDPPRLDLWRSSLATRRG